MPKLIDNLKLNFFYLSVVWNYYTYTYSFFDNISRTVCEKRPSTPWLSSKAFTFDHSLDHRSDFINNLAIFFWTEWPENHKNRCLSSSTNSVDLHFHEGVEKIKENVKNTKSESSRVWRYQSWRVLYLLWLTNRVFVIKKDWRIAREDKGDWEGIPHTHPIP